MMNSFLRFGAAVVFISAGSVAHAGLFGFSSHRSDCCETDCCETECYEPVGCADECGTKSCFSKRPGVLSRLFGCFKKRDVGCCETDCCDVDCCETGCAPQGYQGQVPVYNGYGVARPAPAGRPAPAATTAPAPQRPAPQVAPAPKAAPAPQAAPAPATEEGEVYFPSRFRSPAGVSGAPGQTVR